MSFCHHFASVVRLSVNILHFDLLLENHWTEFNFIFKSNGNQLPRWATQAPWSTFFALEPLVCFGIKVLGIGYQLQNVMFFIGALNCISHAYKYNLNHYILIFCHFVLQNCFFRNVLYAWMYVRTRCYINVDIIMACCFNCSQGIQLCPICRTVITDCIKVYKY